MNIHIGSDHAGFDLKEHLKVYLLERGFTIKDHGTYSAERADYPDYAHAVAEAVVSTEEPGILVCGSGIGVCITANKHKGIRAALAWNKEVAALAREHNNANILCLPARFVGPAEACEMANAFLTAAFEGGRHQQRIEKIEVQ